MPCPYKEGSDMCWLCWNWIESAEYCLYDEDDPQREFVLIDEFKDIDPQTYKERLEWIKGLGLMSLYRVVKAGMVKEQRTLSDFGVVEAIAHEWRGKKRGRRGFERGRVTSSCKVAPEDRLQDYDKTDLREVERA